MSWSSWLQRDNQSFSFRFKKNQTAVVPIDLLKNASQPRCGLWMLLDIVLDPSPSLLLLDKAMP
jgi:hypothetical protein